MRRDRPMLTLGSAPVRSSANTWVRPIPSTSFVSWAVRRSLGGNEASCSGTDADDVEPVCGRATQRLLQSPGEVVGALLRGGRGRRTFFSVDDGVLRR